MVDTPLSGMWPTSNAWFCQHLWDRYLFSGDTAYLAEVYPMMKEACEFFLDFLTEEPGTAGWSAYLRFRRRTLPRRRESVMPS